MSPNTCSICSKLGDFIEIENAQEASDTDVSEGFPQEVEQLRVPNEHLEPYFRYKNERLLKCSDCGTYYWYREWAPGGSEDVLRTYIHEAIRRLSFLEAHVELHDAQYQAYTRAEEYGGSFKDDYETTRRGVQEEIERLRPRCLEIAWDVIHCLKNKYRRSEELAETLNLYAPQLDNSRQIEEQKARDEAVAEYRARILAEYLPFCETDTIPIALIQQLVARLDDTNQTVRKTIKDVLLRVVGDASQPRGIALEILQAAQQLTLPYAEIEELVVACQEVGGAT